VPRDAFDNKRTFPQRGVDHPFLSAKEEGMETLKVRLKEYAIRLEISEGGAH